MSDEASTPPQFGLIDVIEAFTAMRHEFRNQTKETRQVSQDMQLTAEKVERLTGLLSAKWEQTPADDPKTVLALVTALAEIDHSVSRAVEAAQRSIAGLESTSAMSAPRVSATERLASLGPVARFFCRQFAKRLDQDDANMIALANRARNEQTESALSAVVSGLSMTIDHLRRRVTQLGVERVEVTGQAFDGNLMRAVEVVDCSNVPPGHVAEQLSPAYRYQSRVIQFADVRLARP